MAEPDQETIPIASFRMPKATIAKLDAWVVELNASRRGRRLSRNDLIRGVLDWAADYRPEWEQAPPAPKPKKKAAPSKAGARP